MDYEYFIKKFTEFDDGDMWPVGVFENDRVAWCSLEERASLLQLGIKPADVVLVSDGLERGYQQGTPKERVLRFFEDMKQSNSSKKVESILANTQ